MADGEKQTLTPKKTIHQRFGVKASYMIEQVHVSSQNTCLYWCHLQLPEFSVVSNVFKKKQDSEQSTPELALKKFLSADHPLGSHLRETFQRDGECHGSVALSVITAFDIKINNCYKVINNRYKVINPSVS
ncbi:hypothetical protein Bca52824_081837 [Brassica carinata]|uniref:Uncharacterized protein n=1 Tax=Brassica carinata TaxID=52824 RepID=A0A8X7TSA6_BRACI|nr:hypothetical protein Bca52824_081837 [Brassica carinata]